MVKWLHLQDGLHGFGVGTKNSDKIVILHFPIKLLSILANRIWLVNILVSHLNILALFISTLYHHVVSLLTEVDLEQCQMHLCHDWEVVCVCGL